VVLRRIAEICDQILGPVEEKPDPRWQTKLSPEQIAEIRQKGGPDLSSRDFWHPPIYYYEMYQKGYYEGWVDFPTRAKATWGLIANGVDAIPLAMKMLRSAKAEEREDAGGVLGGIGGYFDTVVPEVVAALEAERDTTARDSLIGALGEMRAKQAIPYLARLILDTETDGDTAFGAALSLGRITRHRFDRSSDAIVSARKWLATHDYATVSNDHDDPESEPDDG
jgi:hypothetical protein